MLSSAKTIEDNLLFYSEMIPAIMTLVALIIVIAEWIVLTRLKRIERHKEGIVNVASAALTYLPIFLVNKLFTVSLMFLIYEYRIIDFGFDWYVWVLAYVGYDFMSYVVHVLSHKVRFFWCIHSVHHSPKEMKTSVAFRGSFAEFLLAPHLILWLPLIGFHPLMVIIVEGVGQLYGVPLHFSDRLFGNWRTKKISNFLITPGIHHLHHARNDLYLDTNYGLTFSIWDRLFRTFQREDKSVKPEFGLTKELNSENLVISQTDEFVCLWKDVKSAPGFMNKLRYLVMPPGWDHRNRFAHTAHSVRKRAITQLRNVN